MLMIQGDGVRRLTYQRPPKAMSDGEAIITDDPKASPLINEAEDEDEDVSSEEDVDSDFQDEDTNEK
jgi:hypothetical protein